MLTFNVDSPLLQQELERDKIEEKQSMITYFSRMLNFGLLFLLVGVIVISIYGFPPDKAQDPYRIYVVLFIFWNVITTILLMLPLMVKSYILQALDFQYQQASVEKIHNCEAYINMLGMEQYKYYVESIRTQGRELTNFECDEVIKYYTSQSYYK